MHGPQNVKSSPCQHYGTQSCFIANVDEAYRYYTNVCVFSVDFWAPNIYIALRVGFENLWVCFTANESLIPPWNTVSG
jgi:hypothetical protein